MFLNRIVESKKEEVRRRKRELPLSELESIIRKLPAPRDFSASLRRAPYAVIAEVKRSSPSKGVLREKFDYKAIASLYAMNGASAISVLTDEKYFGGHGSYISEIRKAVELPLLRKDFIIDPYQILETRAIGGDAILLITRLLEENQLRDYIDLAERSGIDPLVEIHNREELEVALRVGAEIIGINNRSLETFKTDIQITMMLAPLIPPGRTVISESGISDRNDMVLLMEKGVHVFLIGEALMRAYDIGRKLKELLGK
jgi:indole-3-glycerol phosphate synthase